MNFSSVVLGKLKRNTVFPLLLNSSKYSYRRVLRKERDHFSIIIFTLILLVVEVEKKLKHIYI